MRIHAPAIRRTPQTEATPFTPGKTASVPLRSVDGKERPVGRTGGPSLLSIRTGACDPARLSKLLTPGLSPFEQSLDWENRFTFPQFRRPSIETSLSVAHAPMGDVADRSIDPAIRALFFRADGAVAWPRHPDHHTPSVRAHGTVVEVPYTDAPEAARWPARYTASRSMVVTTNGRTFSVKMPTDTPNQGGVEPAKADLRKEVDIALVRGRHARDVERERGKIDGLQLMPDVCSVWEKTSGNGFVVRDISAIADDDKHYYLPGFGIVEHGKACGLSPEAIAETEAKLAGASKARMLVHYGLWSKSPHGQNKLYQLDANLDPTGGAVIRDLSDTSFIGPIAEALGFGDVLDAERAAGHQILETIPEDWPITIAGLDASGDVSYGVWMAARPAHDRALIDTCCDLLEDLAPQRSSITTLAELFEAMVNLPRA